MQSIIIIGCIIIVPVVIYIVFRLAGLAWFTSMIEITKNKREEVLNEGNTTKR